MEYRRLGNGILKVSELSFGAWETIGRVDFETSRELMLTAYEAGVNHFDNADEYSGKGNAEQAMGKIIKEMKRSDIILSSKVFWDVGPGPNDRGLSRKHIVETVNTSLKNMDVEYIDFYYCHRYEAAVIGQTDPNLEEVVRAMDDMIHQGKILYWGTSCWNAFQLMQGYATAERFNAYKPSMEQPQYNMFVREAVEKDLVYAARKLGFGIITWSPLYNGILTGKYNNGIPGDSRLADPAFAWLQFDREITPERIEKVKKLTTLAQDLGGSMPQLAIAWLLRLPEVSSVILGANKVAQLQENLKAVELRKKLTPDVLARIEEILDNNPCPPLFAPDKPSFD
ncbi:MAG: aldo/keto reductase [Anaerolineaceae bacterium]|nr:aldo/keto reductase [Anaerolineaceae bacterium]